MDKRHQIYSQIYANCLLSQGLQLFHQVGGVSKIRQATTQIYMRWKTSTPTINMQNHWFRKSPGLPTDRQHHKLTHDRQQQTL